MSELIEIFSEMRIANAFKLPSQLTDADLSEIEKRIKADVSQWKVRMRKLENGGSCQSELARQRKYYKKVQWSERHIGKAKQAELAAGWADFDKRRLEANKPLDDNSLSANICP